MVCLSLNSCIRSVSSLQAQFWIEYLGTWLYLQLLRGCWIRGCFFAVFSMNASLYKKKAALSHVVSCRLLWTHQSCPSTLFSQLNRLAAYIHTSRVMSLIPRIQFLRATYPVTKIYIPNLRKFSVNWFSRWFYSISTLVGLLDIFISFYLQMIIWFQDTNVHL